MADLKLSASRDLDLSTGDLQLVTGLDGIQQEIGIAFRLFQGEWFADTRVGIPYFSKILGARPLSQNVVRGVYRRAALLVPGVETVDEIDVELNGETRAMSISLEATATNGEPVTAREVFIV